MRETFTILGKRKNRGENLRTRELTDGETVTLEINDNNIDNLDNDVAGGNTNTPATNQSQIRRWCFTYWPKKDENGEIDILDTNFDSFPTRELEFSDSKKFVVQLEKGSAGGQKHYQGYIEFKNGRTLNGLKRMWDNTIHWEPARGDASSNYNYCTKISERLAGPWVRGFQMPPELPFTTPKPFQKYVLDIVKEKPDTRSIYWFWERTGNVGKSALAKYLVMMHGALVCSGKGADIKYAVGQWLDAGQPLSTVIYDIPRSNDEQKISWESIECIKNGMFFSSKYESKMYTFNPPHVICFANEPPDMTRLSTDRWKIFNITHLENLITHDNLLGTPRVTTFGTQLEGIQTFIPYEQNTEEVAPVVNLPTNNDTFDDEDFN